MTFVQITHLDVYDAIRRKKPDWSLEFENFSNLKNTEDKNIYFIKKPQVTFDDSKTEIKYISVTSPLEANDEDDLETELPAHTFIPGVSKTPEKSALKQPISAIQEPRKTHQEQFMMEMDALIKKQQINRLTKAFAAVISVTSINSIQPNESNETISQFSQISHKLDDLEMHIISESSIISDGSNYEFHSTEKAQTYLNIHRIYEFFNFLGAHLVAVAPEEPIEFLISLLNECLAYRNNSSLPPPLLFSKRHIERVYYSMDPMGFGFIGKYQYVKGMETLGIKYYDRSIIVNDKMQIEKQFFINEAYARLVSQFKGMINIPEEYYE